MKLVPYKLVNKDGKPYIEVKIKDGEKKVFSPEEISAMILTKMKETAEAYLGKTIKDAVVTVPGKFLSQHICNTGDTVRLLTFLHLHLQLTLTMLKGRLPRMLVQLQA